MSEKKTKKSGYQLRETDRAAIKSLQVRVFRDNVDLVDPTGDRRILHIGRAKEIDKSKTLNVLIIICNDCLLFADEAGDLRHAFRLEYVSLSALSEEIEEPNGFLINNKRKQYAVIASSAKERSDWVKRVNLAVKLHKEYIATVKDYSKPDPVLFEKMLRKQTPKVYCALSKRDVDPEEEKAAAAPKPIPTRRTRRAPTVDPVDQEYEEENVDALPSIILQPLSKIQPVSTHTPITTTTTSKKTPPALNERDLPRKSVENIIANSSFALFGYDAVTLAKQTAESSLDMTPTNPYVKELIEELKSGSSKPEEMIEVMMKVLEARKEEGIDTSKTAALLIAMAEKLKQSKDEGSDLTQKQDHTDESDDKSEDKVASKEEPKPKVPTFKLGALKLPPRKPVTLESKEEKSIEEQKPKPQISEEKHKVELSGEVKSSVIEESKSSEGKKMPKLIILPEPSTKLPPKPRKPEPSSASETRSRADYDPENLSTPYARPGIEPKPSRDLEKRMLSTPSIPDPASLYDPKALALATNTRPVEDLKPSASLMKSLGSLSQTESGDSHLNDSSRLPLDPTRPLDEDDVAEGMTQALGLQEKVRDDYDDEVSTAVLSVMRESESFVEQPQPKPGEVESQLTLSVAEPAVNESFENLFTSQKPYEYNFGHPAGGEGSPYEFQKAPVSTKSSMVMEEISEKGSAQEEISQSGSYSYEFLKAPVPSRTKMTEAIMAKMTDALEESETHPMLEEKQQLIYKKEDQTTYDYEFPKAPVPSKGALTRIRQEDAQLASEKQESYIYEFEKPVNDYDYGFVKAPVPSSTVAARRAAEENILRELQSKKRAKREGKEESKYDYEFQRAPVPSQGGMVTTVDYEHGDENGENPENDYDYEFVKAPVPSKGLKTLSSKEKELVEFREEKKTRSKKKEAYNYEFEKAPVPRSGLASAASEESLQDYDHEFQEISVPSKRTLGPAKSDPQKEYSYEFEKAPVSSSKPLNGIEKDVASLDESKREAISVQDHETEPTQADLEEHKRYDYGFSKSPVPSRKMKEMIASEEKKMVYAMDEESVRQLFKEKEDLYKQLMTLKEENATQYQRILEIVQAGHIYDFKDSQGKYDFTKAPVPSKGTMSSVTAGSGYSYEFQKSPVPSQQTKEKILAEEKKPNEYGLDDQTIKDIFKEKQDLYRQLMDLKAKDALRFEKILEGIQAGYSYDFLTDAKGKYEFEKSPVPSKRPLASATGTAYSYEFEKSPVPSQKRKEKTAEPEQEPTSKLSSESTYSYEFQKSPVPSEKTRAKIASEETKPVEYGLDDQTIKDLFREKQELYKQLMELKAKDAEKYDNLVQGARTGYSYEFSTDSKGSYDFDRAPVPSKRPLVESRSGSGYSYDFDSKEEENPYEFEKAPVPLKRVPSRPPLPPPRKDVPPPAQAYSPILSRPLESADGESFPPKSVPVLSYDDSVSSQPVDLVQARDKSLPAKPMGPSSLVRTTPSTSELELIENHPQIGRMSELLTSGVSIREVLREYGGLEQFDHPVLRMIPSLAAELDGVPAPAGKPTSVKVSASPQSSDSILSSFEPKQLPVKPRDSLIINPLPPKPFDSMSSKPVISPAPKSLDSITSKPSDSASAKALDPRVSQFPEVSSQKLSDSIRPQSLDLTPPKVLDSAAHGLSDPKLVEFSSSSSRSSDSFAPGPKPVDRSLTTSSTPSAAELELLSHQAQIGKMAELLKTDSSKSIRDVLKEYGGLKQFDHPVLRMIPSLKAELDGEVPPVPEKPKS